MAVSDHYPKIVTLTYKTQTPREITQIPETVDVKVEEDSSLVSVLEGGGNEIVFQSRRKPMTAENKTLSIEVKLPVLLEHANDSILPKLETIYVHNNDDLIIENNDNWEYDNENGIVFRL